MQLKTNVKFIKDLYFQILEDNLNEGEENTSLPILECCNCHWRFVGDCNRCGYGYTSEGTDTPNYCPMCGKKIDECVE